MEQFWQYLIDQGLISGQAAYYISGEATPEEYQHAIRTALQSATLDQRKVIVDAAFEAGVAEGDPAYWYAPKGDEDEDFIKATGGFGDAAITDAGGGVKTGQNKESEAENQTKVGVGGGGSDPETQLTILQGREMSWHFDRSSGKWYVEYGLPDSERSIFFEADPDQMDALFGDNKRPVSYSQSSLESLTSKGSVFSGNIGEMEGTGYFEDEVRRVKTLALDNGVLPEWAESTDEIMDIVYIAQSEGKSFDWMLEQISKTQSFSERFPHIQKIRDAGNLSLSQAITGFLEFEAGVTNAIKGIGGNEGIVTPAIVGALLDMGHSLQTVTTGVQRFNRMKEYAPAMQAFNEILISQGKDPITELQDMFDFVSGTAGSDIYDIWEASSVAEAASAAGLGDLFSAEDAMNYAIQTEGQTSLKDATGAFQSAASMLLRLRHQVDVGQFGIEQDDIIDLALGQPLRSGVSPATLQDNMNRAVLQAQKDLQGRTQTFKDLGTSKQKSLASLRESA